MQLITKTIHRQIEEFKENMYLNYKVKVHVFFKETDIPSLPIEDLELLVLIKLKRQYPEYSNINSFRNTRSRKYQIIVHKQIFSYIAHEKYGYTKSEIGRYLNQDHTSVIHSINSINDYFDTDNKYVKGLYNTISNSIKDYVGSISKNSGE